MDFIKIDGSYTQALLKDRALRADLEGMIKSAKVRGLEIVCEFVEHENIAGVLLELGVDYVQGYLYGKPRPLHQLCAVSSI